LESLTLDTFLVFNEVKSSIVLSQLTDLDLAKFGECISLEILKDLSEKFTNLTSLSVSTSRSLNDSKDRDEFEQNFTDGFAQFKCLTSLHLRRFGIKITDSLVVKLVTAMPNLESLEIKLGDNISISSLKQAIQHCKKLMIFDIQSSNMYSGQSVSYYNDFKTGGEKMVSFRQLNQINDKFYEFFIKQHNFTDIRIDRVYSAVTYKLFTLMKRYSPNIETLVILDCWDMDIYEQDLILNELFNLIEKCATTLHTLQMSVFPCAERLQFTAFLRSLSCTNLTSLSLKNCHLLSKYNLQAILSKNTKLKELIFLDRLDEEKQKMAKRWVKHNNLSVKLVFQNKESWDR
jgi:hypothetical protein